VEAAVIATYFSMHAHSECDVYAFLEVLYVFIQALSLEMRCLCISRDAVVRNTVSIITSSLVA
jgi:hypothetical protein